MSLTTLDLAVVVLYAVGLLSIALWVSREPAGETKNTEDYFLAGKSLPWWAIGASLIAANISAEQIIGQSGQGFVVGIAIAAYEWQAAIVLLIVAAFFLPIFLKRGIYTMPQFLETRFGDSVKSTMAVFWIFLFTAVNLTTVLYGGTLAINAVTELAVFPGMAMLAGFALLYSLYGGLKAVALTDIIQVVILIVGGFAITILVLSMVGDGGAVNGLQTLKSEIPEHFEMILSRDHPQYMNLPGIWTLLGGLWVLHFSYWGFNQYIIQRRARRREFGRSPARTSVRCAFEVPDTSDRCHPGDCRALDGSERPSGYVCARSGHVSNRWRRRGLRKPDSTYGVLMTLMPTGVRGLIFAALIAAIVSSLASMIIRSPPYSRWIFTATTSRRRNQKSTMLRRAD